MKENFPKQRKSSSFITRLLSQIFLLLFFVGVSVASNGYSQEILDKRITLKANAQPFKRVLSEIEKSADIRFIYN